MTGSTNRPHKRPVQPNAGITKRSWSLSVLLMALVASAAVAYVALSTLFAALDARQAQRGATVRAAARAERGAVSLAAALERVRGDVVATAADPTIRKGVSHLLSAPELCTLHGGGTGVGITTESSLFRADGSLLCSSADPLVHEREVSVASQDWFDLLAFTPQGASSEPSYLGLFTDPLTGRRSTGYAAPIPEEGRAPRIGVAVFFPLHPVASSIAGTGDRYRFLIAGGEGAEQTILSSSGTPADRDRPADTVLHGMREEHVLGSAPVEGTDLRVVAALRKTAVLSGIWGQLRREAGAAAGVLLLTLVLGALVYRRIVRPIASLTAAVDQAGRVAPQPLAIQGPAEVATLVERFNAMIKAREHSDVLALHRSLHDPLTGLPNRALFLDRLEQARASAEPETVAVLFIDLDRFKVLNDSSGHDVGDLVLMTVARRLRVALPSDATLARFGGDEFVALCVGLGRVEDAAAIAERLRAGVAEPLRVRGEEIALAASVGIASAAHTETSEEVIRNADTAMSRAKEMGGDRALFFEESLYRRAVTRFRTENELRRALEAEELEVHYQPLVDLRTGAVVSMEALVRWRHPTRGLLGPGAFLPVAEETGLVVRVGAFVLREACRQLGEWANENGEVSVSVNLSGREMLDPGLHHTVAGLIRDARIDPSRLTLEVTESSLLEDLTLVASGLSRLREMGVRVSVDDFGTGYSSLAYLDRFPLDQLKLDRSFIAQLTEGHDLALLRSVTLLGHTLGLEVVAEGVETPAQLAALREAGCDLGQGFHFAAAAPAKEAELHLRAGFGSRLGPTQQVS